MDLHEEITRLKKSTLICAAINLIGGGIIFLFISGAANSARMEERDYYDVGDSLNFIGIVFPVLAVCGLTNLYWIIKALVDLIRHRSKEAAMAWGATAVAWVILYGICLKIAELQPISSYQTTPPAAAPARQ